MANTNFSPETAQTLMVAYEYRIEALLGRIAELEKLNNNHLNLK